MKTTVKKEQISDEEINIAIENNIRSNEIEGIYLTKENIDRNKRLLKDEITLDEGLAEIFIKTE